MQPGTLVIPHTHTREDEFTFVYRGTIGVRIGEQDYVAPVGSLVLKPRGILHAMWNPTDEPAILFETITPGGLEGFFEEMGQITIAERQADPTIGETVADRYGLRTHWELVPELMAKHNVRPG